VGRLEAAASRAGEERSDEGADLLAAVLVDAEGVDPEGVVGEIGRGQVGVPLQERAVPVLHDLPDGGEIRRVTHPWRAHPSLLALVADPLAPDWIDFLRDQLAYYLCNVQRVTRMAASAARTTSAISSR
jgi:hypothetical protein